MILKNTKNFYPVVKWKRKATNKLLSRETFSLNVKLELISILLTLPHFVHFCYNVQGEGLIKET